MQSPAESGTSPGRLFPWGLRRSYALRGMGFKGRGWVEHLEGTKKQGAGLQPPVFHFLGFGCGWVLVLPCEYPAIPGGPF